MYGPVNYYNAVVKVLALLLLSSVGNGQALISSTVPEKFAAYNTHTLQEKMFVHTDKSFYLCGEIAWFKLYVTDAVTNQPFDLSKVAYVEIYARDNKPVLQAKIELNNGSGNGSFMLPFSLNSDVYILRAYTNWMKNFGPEHFYQAEITIINPLKKLGKPAVDSSREQVRFFPEGGNLVYGLNSKVAFHAVGKNGRGIACSGTIVDQANTVVANFEARRFGMGTFSFTPVKGNTYKANVQTASGTSLSVDLPLPYEKGYVMALSSAANDAIRIRVQSNVIPDELIFLLAHTRHAVRIAEGRKLQDGSAEFIFPRDRLAEGISHFTLFNERQSPVAERLYFIPPAKKLAIQLQTDKENYGLRQKVNIAMDLPDTLVTESNSSFSMAVFQVDSLQPPVYEDIYSYLWLAADLKGRIESPAYYLHGNDNDTREAADNLVLTHGWSRFKWEHILNDKKPSFEFLPEYEGLLVEGKVIDKTLNQPVANHPAFLSVPGQQFVFKAGSSDNNGNIHFSLNKFYGSNDIIIQAQPGNFKSYEINVSTPFYEKFSGLRPRLLPNLERWQEQLLARSIATQVENSYVQELRQRFQVGPLPDTTAFFGAGDKSYRLDDYTRFITLEEVLREYVAEVRVRKQNEGFTYRVRNRLNHTFLDQEPLVLLDGVPMFDLDKLMRYDPLKLRKIDVVMQKYFAGTGIYDGIISFNTYSGTMDGFELDPNALVFEYPGLQLHREFYAPRYESKEQLEDRTPDFRNVLLWSPQVAVSGKNNALSFYTSDKPGRYAVVVQGLARDGRAGSYITYFNVSK